MRINLIFTQILEVIAWLLLIYSFWKNKDNKILFIQIIANIFFILNYLSLEAYTGLFVVLFEILRDIVYIKVKEDKKVFILSLPIYILIGITAYKGIYSIFSILASGTDGYALAHQGKKVVFFGVITYIMWLIYDLSVKNYVNVVAEALIIISNIVILIKNKNKQELIIRRD